MSGIVNDNASTVKAWFDTYFQAKDGLSGGGKPEDAKTFEGILDGIRNQTILIANGENGQNPTGWGLKQGEVESYLDAVGSYEHAPEDQATKGATYGADGVLDKEEVEEIVTRANNSVYALGTADADGDGVVTKEEWATFMATDEKAQDPGFNMGATMESLDTNGDGEIDADEFNIGLSNQLDTLGVIAIADANHDGEITTEEMEAAKALDLTKAPESKTTTPEPKENAA